MPALACCYSLSSKVNRMKKLVIFVGLVLAATFAPQALAEGPWNIKQLADPPKVLAAPGFQEPGVRALFFEGLPWRGKPTRVFAWHGMPANRSLGKVPAVVLVHGAGGTAFADWVRRWNDRGYAAIAIDTCGRVPLTDPAKRTSSSRPPMSTRDEQGGLRAGMQLSTRLIGLSKTSGPTAQWQTLCWQIRCFDPFLRWMHTALG